MKRLFCLCLAFLMLLSFASCDPGGKKETEEGTAPKTSQRDPSGSSQAKTTEAAKKTEASGSSEKPGDSGDTASLAEFLKLYGYTEEDVKPAHFVSFEDVSLEGKPGEVGSVGFLKIHADPAETTREDINAWFEKVYGKMTQLSQDGKLYKTYLLDTEASSLSQLQEGALWESFPGGSCCYAYELAIGRVALYIATSYSVDTGVYKMSISVQNKLS